ncbi:Partner of Y14 and mago [Pleurostoma richardsiae]|uniref:Partner of Y14 and mago n=1 Tax=Pleurostoma richardsiae TaxID=41990 RepID=A0AA38VQY4_9PEZI|nr:Partner of Y14 and mago [Pleurostoma richardsiae]
MPSQPSNAGIVTDESSGQRHIPSSVRADGSTRRAIKIRPGYRPPEDVEVYKNRTAEGFRSRTKAGGVVGAEGLKDEDNGDGNAAAGSTAANKNAKRREARKRAKAAAEANGGEDKTAEDEKAGEQQQQEASVADPEVEREKKARALKKKLKQAKDLKDRKEGGQSLLPEQIAKVIKISELIRELDALGFDAEGEPKDSQSAAPAKKAEEKTPA